MVAPPWHDLPMIRTRTVVALAMVATFTACNDDGRSLAQAPSVPPSLATTSTTVVGPEIGPQLTLTSPAFDDGAPIDVTFTCDGINVPPPLEIAGVPDGTADLAIAVTDDADGYVHWVLTGLAPTVTSIEPGLIPPGAVTAVTDSGTDGWDGPCPPLGDAPHSYIFTVYAMAEPLGLAAGVDGREAIALVQRAALASDVLTATYVRPAGG